MMGERRVAQEPLFYEFSLDRHVPGDHLLRAIDRFVDLSPMREHLRPFYRAIGRPSIDPELMLRMLIVGYCFGIRSERRLCEEVHLNLAYRWFCRLGLDGDVPDHSTFSKNRHGRFRESDLFRQLFEATVRRCIEHGLVGGDGFAVDASLIRAEANRQNFCEGPDALPADLSGRAVEEYLAVLDDAAFGAATPVEPKRVSPVDPASRYTSAHGGQAQFCYATNYLIDVKHAVIVDVEASTAVRQAEVTAAKRMIERVADGHDLWPRKLIADTGYGSAEMLAWLVHERGIEPHVPVFDKSGRTDGSFDRTAFTFDHEQDHYLCPAGKELKRFRRRRARSPRHGAGARPGRRVDHLTVRAQEGRDAVRPPQAHHAARPPAITRSERRKRRVPPRSCRPEPSKAHQTPPGPATCRSLRGITLARPPPARSSASANSRLFQRHRPEAVEDSRYEWRLRS